MWLNDVAMNDYANLSSSLIFWTSSVAKCLHVGACAERRYSGTTSRGGTMMEDCPTKSRQAGFKELSLKHVMRHAPCADQSLICQARSFI